MEPEACINLLLVLLGTSVYCQLPKSGKDPPFMLDDLGSNLLQVEGEILPNLGANGCHSFQIQFKRV